MKRSTLIICSLAFGALLVGCASSEEDGAPLPTDKVNQQFEMKEMSGADTTGGSPAKPSQDKPVSDQ